MHRYAILAAASLVSLNVAQASVVLTASDVAPALNPGAQYNLVDDHVDWGADPFNYTIYTDNHAGQSFTVPAGPSVKLASFSLKGIGNSGGNLGAQTWTVIVSSISGTDYTPMLTATGISGSEVTNNTDWLTWSFSDADAKVLDGGGVYGVQVTCTTWFGFAASNLGDNNYADGKALITNSEWGPGIYTYDYDRTFVANLTAVPEPTTLAVLAGSAGLILMRRRRA